MLEGLSGQTYWHQNNKRSGIYLQTQNLGMYLHTFTQKKSKRTEGLSEDKKQWDPDISIPNYSLNLPSNHDSVIFPLLPHISPSPSYNSVPFRNEERKWMTFRSCWAWKFRGEISNLILSSLSNPYKQKCVSNSLAIDEFCFTQIKWTQPGYLLFAWFDVLGWWL